MEVSDKKLREISQRILRARMRILINNGFYGLLLMHMKISLGDEYDTAWTDCKERIWFYPPFVDEISDQELDYVLMHEILHAALQHASRIGDYDTDLYNKAADIVVNSNIMHSNYDNEETISIQKFGGPMPHVAPDGREGFQYSVEELYQMMFGAADEGSDEEGDGEGNQDPDGDGESDSDGKGAFNKNGDGRYKGWDYHVGSEDSGVEELENKLKWDAYMKQAAEAISIRDPQKTRGLIPALAERYLEELKKSQIDWRQMLVEFLQDEINDYSFTPPDRRMEECPFFLPDFNERDENPGKILFAVDTSGSMSDKQITACYAEIKGAIEQFNGRLEGWLSFFDANMTKPEPFNDVDELLTIRPKGGGGTSFHVIFQYLDEIDEEEYPKSIVILTDGVAPYPNEKLAKEIPVLWIINNEELTPPWGKVTRIK